MAKNERLSPLAHCAEKAYNDLVAAGRIHHSVDFLPYTEGFELVYARVSRELALTRHELHCTLVNLRKSGRCQAPPRGGREASCPAMF